MYSHSVISHKINLDTMYEIRKSYCFISAESAKCYKRRVGDNNGWDANQLDSLVIIIQTYLSTECNVWPVRVKYSCSLVHSFDLEI